MESKFTRIVANIYGDRVKSEGIKLLGVWSQPNYEMIVYKGDSQSVIWTNETYEAYVAAYSGPADGVKVPKDGSMPIIDRGNMRLVHLVIARDNQDELDACASLPREERVSALVQLFTKELVQ